MTTPDDPVAVLHRWADAGVTVGLYRCDGGEEVDRISSTDPRLLHYLAGRTSSEE